MCIFRMKKVMTIVLTILLIFGMSVSASAEEEYKITGLGGGVMFSGTYEECQTYRQFFPIKYRHCGGSYEIDDGTATIVLYGFGGDNRIRFDFKTMKMKWIDNTYWNITYNGPLDYDYLESTYSFTDDAINAFCPEFAATHILIPENAPDNFVSVLEKVKGAKAKVYPAVQLETNTLNVELYETFNEIDYANRYPEVVAILGADKLTLWSHYINYGKAEGRIALFDVNSDNTSESYETFDYEDYASRYADVKEAFGLDKEALWNHYCMHGIKEGRIANFDNQG